MAAQLVLTVGQECFLTATKRVIVVEVLGLSEDSIWVSYPTSDIIKDGTGVELTFKTEDGFVGFHAHVSAGPKVNQGGIMLERSESGLNNRERRNWRVPCNFPVSLQVVEQPEVHSCRMVDITIDGLMLYSKWELEPGAMVSIRFNLPNRPTTVAQCRVVYCDPTPDGDSNRYGLRFEDVKQEGKESLTWFLYERIREIYPRQLSDLYPRPPKHTLTRR
ncbi:MAG: PilZ domain-containing protein [Candidatus Hydrogenedentota bacterium]